MMLSRRVPGIQYCRKDGYRHSDQPEENKLRHFFIPLDNVCVYPDGQGYLPQ